MKFTSAKNKASPVKAIFTYGDVLNGNLHLLNSDKTISLEGRELHFGESKASGSHEKGLFITGDLNTVNAVAWSRFFTWLTQQIPHNNSDELLAGAQNLLQEVNVTIKNLNAWDYHFNNLGVK